MYKTCQVIGALATIGLAFLGSKSSAQLNIIWDSGGHFAFPVSTVTPPAIPDGQSTSGQRLDLTGTITNTSTDTLYVSTYTVYGINRGDGQGLDFQNNHYVSGPYAAGLVSELFNTNEAIAPGATLSGILSSIFIDSSTAQGLYDRDYSLAYTYAGVTELTLYSDSAPTTYVGIVDSPNISIQIGAVSTPEPSALSACLCLIGTAFAARRVRLRKRL